MQRASEHDVLIVGAGPAGAHLALRLAREGLVVGLLDRATFPRPKPCGEFLSPECLPLLDEVGLLDATLALGPARVAGMRLAGFGRAAHGHYRRLADATAPEHGIGLRREELDRLAVRRAAEHPAIDVRLGWSVGRPLARARQRVSGVVARAPDGRPVELRAGFVVGADGSGSRVARGLGWHAVHPTLDRWAIVARFAGVEQRELAEVHFVDGGYFAACSTDAGTFTANLVVGRDALRACAVPQRATAVFDAWLARAPELAERLAGARMLEAPRACGPLCVRATRRTGPGAALVGDAAGFVDPLTGEGLYFAMRGAALLAEALTTAHADRAREAAALRRYERAQRLELGPRRAFARLLQHGLRHPALVRRALGTLAAHPGLADLVVTWTGDTLAPRALARGRTWRAALRAT